MERARYYNGDNTDLALSNLYFGDECSVVEILDVVEDSNTAEELVTGLNTLKIREKFTVDRITDKYVRLKSKDVLGNIHYFKAYYE